MDQLQENQPSAAGGLGSNWIKLVRYTEAGYLPIDNNPALRYRAQELAVRQHAQRRDG